MDLIKATDFYKKLLEQQKLPQFEKFAKETGFDPRRDVRELLFAGAPTGGVLLARGTFHINPEPVQQAKAKLVKNPAARVVLILGFPDIYAAGDIVPVILEAGPIACEGLDEKIIGGLRERRLKLDAS